ncbi:MAG: hypothetical protein H6642_07650 [Caldilineaceae bacterium]|nr:hypothetical protein [Caldilineaceae bacterium]
MRPQSDTGPIAINMRDYGNMEKVGSLGIAMQRTVAFFDQYVKGQERLSE